MARGTKGKSIHQMLKHASPEIAGYLRAAHKQQFEVSFTSKCHYKVTTPPGRTPKRTVFAPGTPSEYRATANTRRLLRSIGVDIP